MKNSPQPIFINKNQKIAILNKRYEKLKQIANEKNLKNSTLLVNPIQSRKVLKQ